MAFPISRLTFADPITGNELLPVVQNLKSFKVNLSAVVNTPITVGTSKRSATDRFKTLINVLDYGAIGNGVTDDINAVLSASQVSKYLFFPRINNTDTTYYLGSYTSGLLSGVHIKTDTGVDFSIANIDSTIIFENDVPVRNRGANALYTYPKTLPTYKKETVSLINKVSPRLHTAIDATNLLQIDVNKCIWPTDTFVADTNVVRFTNQIQFSAISPELEGPSFRGAFLQLGPWETVSAHFTNGVQPGPIGIIIRTTSGYHVIYTIGGTNNYIDAYKPLNGALQGNTPNITWSNIGQNNYTSYQSTNSVWSIKRIGVNKIIVQLNGKALSTPIYVTQGDITEVGFVCYTNGAFSITGLTLERRTDAIIGGQVLQDIRVFGDSTSSDTPGCWVNLLKPILDGAFGVKLNNVTNYAVAGDSFNGQYSIMQQVGFGEAYYVIIALGTNHVQGLDDINSFKSIATQTIDYVLAAGRRPVIVIPWMWYTQAQSGQGQPSANYEKGAPYRMALERLAIEKGCVLVKPCNELPNPDPAYLTTQPGAALLADNIHQDVLGYQYYAQSIAQAIADDYISMPDSVEVYAHWFLNGSTNYDVVIATDKAGMITIGGTMGVTIIASGTPVIRLPRWARPKRDTNFIAQCLTAGGGSILGQCYLNYSTSTGNISIINVPANTAVVIFNFSFKSSASD